MAITELDRYWIVETATMAYAFGVNARGALTHAYWGRRLPYAADYPAAPDNAGWAAFSGPDHLQPEEYPGYGGVKYTEPCLKATFADGVRDVVLPVAGADLCGDDELVVTLHDAHYPLVVALHYRAHVAADLIERWAVIANQGDTPVVLERVFSAQWHLPYGGPYRLTQLSGRWLGEFRINREVLAPGVKVRESRRLTTSHHASPWFAIDRVDSLGGGASEDQGEVWFGALAWSGNWKLTAEVTDFGSTRVGLGVNDWDFAWRLDPGEQFVTPACVGGYTPDGHGAASRLLHDYIRDEVIPHGSVLHKVLYNSWEATLFAVDEPSQARLAELAAAMGVELFVMDDGWFQGRTWDNAGLGDWWPDRAKFPNGLNPLIERVNALGMEFGLWVEPEMVNPDSDLYRAHPDWVLHFPNRSRTEMRNQLILNLARPDVQAYLIDVLDRLLAAHNIRFIKWDMNRNVSEPGWPDAPREAREVWVRYVQGLYRVWGTLRQRHPHVIWQSCSGGGGRADLGILRLADQIWVSDNTGATARLEIQEGFSQLFPANTMEAWVTDMGRGLVPLEFRLHVSMCGSLGIGGNLLEWTPEERSLAAAQVALYKDIRPIVQLGDQYRLHPAQGQGFTAVQYVSKDKATGVLFAFRVHLAEPALIPPLYLRGLDPLALYRVEGYADVRSGQAWMSLGLTLELRDLQSTVRRIWKV